MCERIIIQILYVFVSFLKHIELCDVISISKLMKSYSLYAFCVQIVHKNI